MLRDGLSADAVYQQLYADHAGAVLTYLTNKLRDPDTAQDIAQDAWERAHKFLPGTLANGHGVNKAWLMRVATNAMTDHWRRVQARPQTTAIDDALAPGVSAPDTLMDWETPEGAALLASEHDERRAQAAVLLELLPRRYRRVLWLREWRGYDYARLGAAMRITIPAVKSLLLRTRHAQRAFGLAMVDRIGAQFWGALQHPPIDRLDEGPCWRWRWACAPRPRLTVTLQPNTCRTYEARRLAYVLVRGPLPPWASLSVRCSAPDCVSPWHVAVAGRGGRDGGRIGRHYVALPAWQDAETAPRRLAPGNAVRARRLRIGVTQQALADRAGVALSSVAILEGGALVLPSTERAVMAALVDFERTEEAVPALTPAEARRRRETLGLSIDRLCAISDLHPASVGGFERGQRALMPWTLRRLTTALSRLETTRGAPPLPSGAEIRARREACGLSTAALALAADAGWPAVRRYENGDPGTRNDTRRRVAAALDRLERERQGALA